MKRIIGWIILVESILFLAVFFQAEWKSYLSALPIELRFPQFSDLWEPVSNVDNVNINHIARNFSIEDSLLFHESDSIPETFTGGGIATQFDVGDTIPTDTLAVNVIENFEDESGNLPLDAFFRSLKFIQNFPDRDSVVRIAHYGDSQIEGDRITQHLRYYFQKQFGGAGLGYIPFLEAASHHSFQRINKGWWTKYSVFQNKYKSGLYGASGCTFRYQKILSDRDKEKLLQNRNIEPLQASMKIVFPYKRQPYDEVKLMWGNAEVPFLLQVLNHKDSLVFEKEYTPSVSFNLSKLDFLPDSKGFRIKFTSNLSPDLYGILVESKKGIQIDNYALRGHSGIGLTTIDKDFLMSQYDLLGTKLIIFQYGGNIVGYDSPNFKWFENEVYRMLMYYKKIAPDASILVVGVGDAGFRKDDKIYSFASVPKIRDAQKNACLRAGVAFWDLYEVMGGKNAIIAWAKERPALVGHDFAHFTPHGQRLVANMLYSALMKEYNNFLKTESRKNNKAVIQK